MADETRFIAYRTSTVPIRASPGRVVAKLDRLLPIPPEGCGVEIEDADGSDSYEVRSTVLFVDPRTGDVELRVNLR